MPSTELSQATILFHKAVGRGYYRLVLKAPEIAKRSRPGQFVMLRVTDTMDPLLARPFGISSLITKSSIEIYYRVAGKGTTLLTRRETGQTVGLLGPLGNGFPMPEKGTTPLLIAGGSGFPPLHFLSVRAGAKAHLFVGARDKECLPPVSVLKNFRERTAHVHIATEDGSVGVRGMTTDLLLSFLNTKPKAAPVLYACGPHAMLAAVGRIAADQGIPCHVSMEERMACGLGACMGCSIPQKAGGYKRACKEGPVFDSRDIDWSEQVMVKLRR